MLNAVACDVSVLLQIYKLQGSPRCLYNHCVCLWSHARMKHSCSRHWVLAPVRAGLVWPCYPMSHTTTVGCSPKCLLMSFYCYIPTITAVYCKTRQKYWRKAGGELTLTCIPWLDVGHDWAGCSCCWVLHEAQLENSCYKLYDINFMNDLYR